MDKSDLEEEKRAHFKLLLAEIDVADETHCEALAAGIKASQASSRYMLDSDDFQRLISLGAIEFVETHDLASQGRTRASLVECLAMAVSENRITPDVFRACASDVVRLILFLIDLPVEFLTFEAFVAVVMLLDAMLAFEGARDIFLHLLIVDNEDATLNRLAHSTLHYAALIPEAPCHSLVDIWRQVDSNANFYPSVFVRVILEHFFGHPSTSSLQIAACLDLSSLHNRSVDFNACSYEFLRCMKESLPRFLALARIVLHAPNSLNAKQVLIFVLQNVFTAHKKQFYDQSHVVDFVPANVKASMLRVEGVLTSYYLNGHVAALLRQVEALSFQNFQSSAMLGFDGRSDVSRIFVHFFVVETCVKHAKLAVHSSSSASDISLIRRINAYIVKTGPELCAVEPFVSKSSQAISEWIKLIFSHSWAWADLVNFISLPSALQINSVLENATGKICKQIDEFKCSARANSSGGRPKSSALPLRKTRSDFNFDNVLAQFVQHDLLGTLEALANLSCVLHGREKYVATLSATFSKLLPYKESMLGSPPALAKLHQGQLKPLRPNFPLPKDPSPPRRLESLTRRPTMPTPPASANADLFGDFSP